MKAAADTAIERYYRLHSGIYDATRWSFLFGREAILERAEQGQGRVRRILEVGCGTGRNLVGLCRRFQRADVVGVDLSPAMLELSARKVKPYGSRVRLLRQAYDAPIAPEQPFDLILFSYALSMFNPGFEAAIEAASADLAPGGRIAVVDFHDSRFGAFERWMGVNHVRMNGQLQPRLHAHFASEIDELRAAYGGLWRYLIYIGRKAAA